jgi:hypothetical protein
MRRCWSLVLLATACCLAAQGQTPLSVAYQKTLQLPVAGATAAYSLDPNIADATAANGVVEIVAKAPGSTNIVVVTSAGAQTLAVMVPVPPPILPPGFEPPERQGTGESGTYEFRYNSDPNQITNSIELKRTQGKSFTRMQVINANLFSASGSTSAIGFPFLAYQISRPDRDITFVDKNVVNSPLTLDGFLVRGFHMRQGPWEFHGGFTSIATFQGLFLSTDREYTAGVTRVFRIDDVNSLEANAYYFQNPASQRTFASNGAVGSVVYRRKLSDKGNFLAELGVSHGFGFATRATFDDKRNHLLGNFHIQSRNFASLAVNNQHGTFADLNASRKLTERLYASLDLNQSNYNLFTLSQNTFTTSSLLNFKLNQNFSVNGGGGYATFQSKIPVGPAVTTVNLPAGVDYSTRHFGTGFQYQRTINIEGGGGGNDYAVNALDRAGIVASTPEQLADLLHNTAILQLLGFTNAFVVNLAPSRNDLNAAVSWMSHSQNRRKVDLSYFDSDTELLQGHFILKTATLSYSQRLKSTNDIVGSAAMVQTTNNGVTSTHPLFSISIQHRFFTVPTLLLPGRHGMIEGHIFRDDDSVGLYNAQMPAMGGVEVRLDEDRVTHTDSGGYYAFHHVPFGVHRVEAKLQSDEPFFFTTDSPATVDMNATADFGINFAKGQIFGFLLNDAGSGINGITVELKGEKVTHRVQTGVNGKFAFTGLVPGTYSVATLPDSYPPGYALQDVAAQIVAVESGKPASTEFKVKALRSIAGRVLVYDKGTLQTVPLAGAVVRLKEVSLETKTGETKTGATGAYIFRNLAAGTYTVAIENDGKEISRTVVVPAGPASVRDVDLNAGTKEAPAQK